MAPIKKRLEVSFSSEEIQTLNARWGTNVHIILGNLPSHLGVTLALKAEMVKAFRETRQNLHELLGNAMIIDQGKDTTVEISFDSDENTNASLGGMSAHQLTEAKREIQQLLLGGNKITDQEITQARDHAFKEFCKEDNVYFCGGIPQDIENELGDKNVKFQEMRARLKKIHGNDCAYAFHGNEKSGTGNIQSTVVTEKILEQYQLLPTQVLLREKLINSVSRQKFTLPFSELEIKQHVQDYKETILKGKYSWKKMSAAWVQEQLNSYPVLARVEGKLLSQFLTQIRDLVQKKNLDPVNNVKDVHELWDEALKAVQEGPKPPQLYDLKTMTVEELELFAAINDIPLDGNGGTILTRMQLKSVKSINAATLIARIEVQKNRLERKKIGVSPVSGRKRRNPGIRGIREEQDSPELDD